METQRTPTECSQELETPCYEGRQQTTLPEGRVRLAFPNPARRAEEEDRREEAEERTEGGNKDRRDEDRCHMRTRMAILEEGFHTMRQQGRLRVVPLVFMRNLAGLQILVTTQESDEDEVRFAMTNLEDHPSQQRVVATAKSWVGENYEVKPIARISAIRLIEKVEDRRPMGLTIFLLRADLYMDAQLPSLGPQLLWSEFGQLLTLAMQAASGFATTTTETRLKEERISRDGRREFGDGFQIWVPAMGTMGGVAIIMTGHFQGEVLHFFADTQGRWAWIWMEMDGHKLVRVTTRPMALLDHKLLMIEVLSPALVETKAPPPTVPHWMFRDLLYLRLIRQHWEYWEKLRTPGTSAATHFQMGLQGLAALLLARAKATRQAHMRTGQKYGERLEELGSDPPEGEEEEWWIQWATLKAQWEEWQEEDARKWGVVSKTKWVRLRERMSAAFFGQMQTRGRAMVITVLQHPFQTDELVVETTQEILRYAKTFYSDLYTESERWGEEEIREAARTGVWKKATTKLREEQSRELKEAITSQEITKALADMPKRKAAGLDGLPMDHLQAAEEVFMPLLQELCNAFFVEGQSRREGFGEATIILLHKKGDLTDIRNWRPGSLLSAAYKLYAKILANRMTKPLPSLIHPTQTGFVPGREILTNAIMAREVLHRAADTVPPVAVLLLDFEKAYDRVRWRFLLQGLEERGFGDRFGRTVGCLLATATPRRMGGMGLLDPHKQAAALKMRTVLWLLLERDDAPWKILILHSMAQTLRVDLADVETALLHPQLQQGLTRDELWSPTLEKWRKAPLRQKVPQSIDQILGQSLFGNRHIGEKGHPFPWQGKQGVFGRQWLKCGVHRVGDLWDREKGSWKEEEVLDQLLRHQPDKRIRLARLRQAIPKEWVGRMERDERIRGEWVALRTGEILGFMDDELLRKHLPRTFSLIKNESWGIEDDQIPS
ncbi:hypothetical protein CBR_g51285 [Chara braunii]|uniref:Reverse transcriptase domain-containing protein n=1 Tax=Chara braunii TaxID=69332 RepID=A0A388M869_CHABU|nr:hypothetical protein CBR_g51285 [Chara braunii]|eukprot:GBG90778.1 hypothetical protein CBR_g51285 [Chara braunii]